MYKIEKGAHGYTLTFSGSISVAEMKKWKEESAKALATASGSFGVFVDMRNLNPLPADAQAEMEEGQKQFKAKGMTKSVVVLSSPVVTMQFKRLAKQSGIYAWERYIDASNEPNWQQKGLDWLTKGIDPDA